MQVEEKKKSYSYDDKSPKFACVHAKDTRCVSRHATPACALTIDIIYYIRAVRSNIRPIDFYVNTEKSSHEIHP